MDRRQLGMKAFVIGLLFLVTVMGSTSCSSATNRLVGRAVLPASTFSTGPTSGQYIGPGPINGQEVPFENAQPVQGFSAILSAGDDEFLVMSDNGFGSIENSADYHLRVYRIRPDFETSRGGRGSIEVLSFFELRDPNRHIPFTIVNEFSDERILTGADFDIESFRQTQDGTFWFGDEFGPFLIHTDEEGRVLEPPFPLPDRDGGGDLRSPQNPFNEEISALRVMNAFRAHARSQESHHTLTVSPSHLLLDDGDSGVSVDERTEPNHEGDRRASSKIFNVESLRTAGFRVVPWTVNERNRMEALLDLGVNGIITDRPDILRSLLETQTNTEEDSIRYVDDQGLFIASAFDFQGHRGARGLRPENTLPSMEAALDNLVTTLETDLALTSDRIPVLSHEPRIDPRICTLSDGSPISEDSLPLIKELTVEAIQNQFICNRLQERFPGQSADPNLSPVSASYISANALAHLYTMPTLAQLFDFVDHYAEYYRAGPGSSHPDAQRRALNAARVRFNIEIKYDPTSESGTWDRETFVESVGAQIMNSGYPERMNIQSFDFTCLITVQNSFPEIQTSYLFSDENLRNATEGDHRSSPWLAGLYWPYRITTLSHPFRVRKSGGIEGMALSGDGGRLFPMLEKPLVAEDRSLLIFEFDVESRNFTEISYRYELEEEATSIGDFTMIDENRGLVIERDDSEANLDGFKAIYEIQLTSSGKAVSKTPVLDLLSIPNPEQIGIMGAEGDVGLGDIFAFPFFTIECLIIIDSNHLGIANDNNYPLSVGRHAGSGLPDDSELIIVEIAHTL